MITDFESINVTTTIIEDSYAPGFATDDVLERAEDALEHLPSLSAESNSSSQFSFPTAKERHKSGVIAEIEEALSTTSVCLIFQYAHHD